MYLRAAGRAGLSDLPTMREKLSTSSRLCMMTSGRRHGSIAVPACGITLCFCCFCLPPPFPPCIVRLQMSGLPSVHSYKGRRLDIQLKCQRSSCVKVLTLCRCCLCTSQQQ